MSAWSIVPTPISASNERRRSSASQRVQPASGVGSSSAPTRARNPGCNAARPWARVSEGRAAKRRVAALAMRANMALAVAIVGRAKNSPRARPEAIIRCTRMSAASVLPAPVASSISARAGPPGNGAFSTAACMGRRSASPVNVCASLPVATGVGLSPACATACADCCACELQIVRRG